MTYRADIEGLRTVAVASVVLCHADAHWLPDGLAGAALSAYVRSKGRNPRVIYDAEVEPHRRGVLPPGEPRKVGAGLKARAAVAALIEPLTPLLEDCTGHVQRDDYEVYDGVVRELTLTHMGCGAHLRRRLFRGHQGAAAFQQENADAIQDVEDRALTPVVTNAHLYDAVAGMVCGVLSCTACNRRAGRWLNPGRAG